MRSANDHVVVLASMLEADSGVSRRFGEEVVCVRGGRVCTPRGGVRLRPQVGVTDHHRGAACRVDPYRGRFSLHANYRLPGAVDDTAPTEFGHYQAPRPDDGGGGQRA
jgi:hypothetical protein